MENIVPDWNNARLAALRRLYEQYQQSECVSVEAVVRVRASVELTTSELLDLILAPR